MVNIYHDFSRLCLGKYSPIITSPSANNRIERYILLPILFTVVNKNEQTILCCCVIKRVHDILKKSSTFEPLTYVQILSKKIVCCLKVALTFPYCQRRQPGRLPKCNILCVQEWICTQTMKTLRRCCDLHARKYKRRHDD